LTNNLFDGNSGGPDMCGGVTISGGPITLDSNIFFGNSGGGSYLSLYGGGACIRPSLFSTVPEMTNDIILTNNVFDSNTCSAFYYPGGLYVAQIAGVPPHIMITNNTFINNKAKNVEATAGVAILMYAAGFLDIHNNIFWNNLAGTYPEVLRDIAGNLPDSVTWKVLL
jgi:hypothetical protein